MDSVLHKECVRHEEKVLSTLLILFHCVRKTW